MNYSLTKLLRNSFLVAVILNRQSNYIKRMVQRKLDCVFNILYWNKTLRAKTIKTLGN